MPSALSATLSLTGNAQHAEAKELAGRLVANADAVHALNNHSSAQPRLRRQQRCLDHQQGEIQRYLQRNLDGLNISLDTQKGMHSLRASVLSTAEQQLAIETARNIRGGRGVDADALRVAS